MTGMLMRSFFLMIMAVMLVNGAVWGQVLEGALVQGSLVRGKTEPGSQVFLDDAPVQVSPKGVFVVGFAWDAKAARLRGEKGGQLLWHRDLSFTERPYQTERVDGLPPKTVTPPPEWRERRKIETGRVATARSYNTDDLFWNDAFIRPAEGRFSGFFGSHRILNGKPRSPHYGLDIAGPVGRPVYAPAGGTVRLAARDFLLEGGIVIIDHGFGVTSTLFHMADVTVHEGEFVDQGAQVGTIGATGRASGPHVDWRLNWGRVRLDPGLVIGLEP